MDAINDEGGVLGRSAQLADRRKKKRSAVYAKCACLIDGY